MSDDAGTPIEFELPSFKFAFAGGELIVRVVANDRDELEVGHMDLFRQLRGRDVFGSSPPADVASGNLFRGRGNVLKVVVHDWSGRRLDETPAWVALQRWADQHGYHLAPAGGGIASETGRHS